MSSPCSREPKSLWTRGRSPYCTQFLAVAHEQRNWRPQPGGRTTLGQSDAGGQQLPSGWGHGLLRPQWSPWVGVWRSRGHTQGCQVRDISGARQAEGRGDGSREGLGVRPCVQVERPGAVCVWRGLFQKKNRKRCFTSPRGPRGGTCPHLTRGLRRQAWRPEQCAVSSWCPLLLAERRVTEEVC